MKLLKSLNNNIVLVEDEDGSEVVLFGTGIGYKRLKNEVIEKSDIQKEFRIKRNDRLSNILSSIPTNIMDITEDIVRLSAENLEQTINDSIYVTLADHLRSAVDRAEKKIRIKNPLQWEIPHLYKTEYQIGRMAINMVDEKYSIRLFDEEATFIALHLVNAQYETREMEYTIKLTETLGRIIDIVNYHYQISVNEMGINYSRFVTHLRYFIIRQKEKVPHEDNLGEEIYRLMKELHHKSYDCAQKIAKYLSSSFNWSVNDDEIVYLILHIERLIQEMEENKKF